MEAIKKKIEKLLAFKADAEKRDSQGEVENAAARIGQLLLKYNLELADIGTNNPVTREFLKDGFKIEKRHGQWIPTLAMVLSEHFLTKAIMYKVGGETETIAFIGKAQNVEVTLYTLYQLVARIKNLESRSWSEYEGSDKRGAYRRAFLKYAVTGLHKVLREIRTIEKKNEKVDALIKVSGSEIQDWIEEKYPNLKKGRKSGKLGSTDGAIRGFTEGQKIKLHSGLDAKAPKNFLK